MIPLTLFFIGLSMALPYPVGDIGHVTTLYGDYLLSQQLLPKYYRLDLNQYLPPSVHPALNLDTHYQSQMSIRFSNIPNNNNKAVWCELGLREFHPPIWGKKAKLFDRTESSHETARNNCHLRCICKTAINGALVWALAHSSLLTG